MSWVCYLRQKHLYCHSKHVHQVKWPRQRVAECLTTNFSILPYLLQSDRLLLVADDQLLRSCV